MYANYLTNQSNPGGNWKLEQYYLFHVQFRISNQESCTTSQFQFVNTVIDLSVWTNNCIPTQFAGKASKM